MNDRVMNNVQLNAEILQDIYARKKEIAPGAKGVHPPSTVSGGTP
jgi:hypothetical protein